MGEVALDNPNLVQELAVLRRTALALDSSGLRTKLLIPNDQIKYLALDGTRVSEDTIYASLDGQTPYAVDELQIDYSRGGGRTYVAAVPKETLAEAEAFAVDNRFGPICFAAVPEPFTFVGEAFFGPTAAALAHLPAGSVIERDDAAVTVIGAAHLPNLPPMDPPKQTVAPPVAEPVPEPVPETNPEPETPPDPQTAADTPNVNADTPESPVSEADLAEALSNLPSEPEPESTDPIAPKDVAEPPAAADPGPEVVFASRSRTLRADTDEVPSSVRAAPAAPLRQIDGEPAFASRNAAQTPRKEPTVLAVPTGTGPKAPPVSVDDRSTLPENTIPPPVFSASPPKAETSVPALGTAAAPALDTAPKIEGLAARGPDAAPETSAPEAEAAPKQKSGLFRSRRKSGKRPTTPAPADASTEKDRLTVFGARKPKPEQQIGGKPKYLGLILTALLLLFMIVVAALAARNEDGLAGLLGFGAGTVQTAETGADLVVPIAVDAATETQAAVVPEVTPPDPNESVVAANAGGDIAPTAEAAPQIDQNAASLLANILSENIANQTVSPSTELAPDGTPLTPAEAQRIYEATGVWQRAPRLPLQLKSEPGPDVALWQSDALAKASLAVPATPSMSGADSPFLTVPNPPSPDTVFDRDDRGFIRATPEGTILPDGTIVFAGKPNVLPPLRPSSIAPQVDLTNEDPAAPSFDTPADEQAAVSAGAVALTALQPGLRPRLRPETLAPAPIEDPVVAAADPALAGVRPKQRPADLAPPQAAEPEPESEPAPPLADVEAIAAAIAAAAPPDPAATATELAPAASTRPDSRPRNFDRVVQAAQRAPAAAAAAPATAPTVSRNATVAPSGPVPGGVASAATTENAINLRDINLLGVSGSPGNRIALIRMGNGSILRVKVGDRLDGGQVTAIGEHSLNYTKRGRSYTLEVGA